MFDVILASAGLCIAIMPLIIAAYLIRRDGGPPLYIQKRVGKDGTLFRCYKMRSMHRNAKMLLKAFLHDNPEKAVQYAAHQKLRDQDDIRVTKVGRWLRKFNIDELPQLWNVLKGEMSLVGPRPIMPHQRKLSGVNLLYYTQVLPGITGLWQVSGRNQLTFTERMRMECMYVRTRCFTLDMLILFKTIPVVFQANPVAQDRA